MIDFLSLSQMKAAAFSRIGLHMLFWCVFWLSVSSIAMLYEGSFDIFLIRLMEMPLYIVGTYLFTGKILPLVLNKRLVSFTLCTLLFLIGYTILHRMLLKFVLFPLYYTENDYAFHFFNWHRIFSDLWGMIGAIAIYSAIHYLYRFSQATQRIKALNEEKKQAELRFLQAQIHPHFLFNTLNSIYYEALNKSDTAPELIIKLSEILRFVLYEMNETYVPIEKEIELVQNYSELMRSRYGERLTVKLTTDSIEHIQIPQMILFSITENAFKHGISEQSGDCLISIEVKRVNNHIHFRVQNTYTNVSSQNDLLGSKRGIGIQNLERQLKLNFDDNYTLNSMVEDGLYTCELIVPIL